MQAGQIRPPRAATGPQAIRAASNARPITNQQATGKPHNSSFSAVKPFVKGQLLRTVSHLPHVKEHVMEGHPSCRDTFSTIWGCPLKSVFALCQINCNCAPANQQPFAAHKIYRQSFTILCLEIRKSIFLQEKETPQTYIYIYYWGSLAGFPQTEKFK